MGVKLSEWRLKLTETVERTMNKINGAAEKGAAKFTALQSKINKLSDGIKGAASEVPGLNRAMELATNPYVAIAATLMALGTLFFTGGKKAAEFNHQFLELQNLNLDKTQAQMKTLNDRILDLSITEGLDPVKTAQAFFDVQSATGKFGAEVEAIVQKVGRFSLATKTEMPAAINGAVKAMKAFGFGAEKMDEYLESSAKTVQVGITTFDELAKVQTEFGGAAAAAGQDFNTANKVFASFTAIAKDANVAATMTKGAFQGLTMKSTVDGFKKAGVNMFDATGKMRNMDQIIEQLVPKIKKMNDADFLKFRNEIGGPEGLQNMLNQLRASGEDVLATFTAFDNTKFNIEDALKNAKGDFTTLSSIVSSQFSGIMIKLGQLILPTVARIMDKVSVALIWVGKNFNTITTILKSVATVIGIAGAAWMVFKAQMLIAQLVTMGMIGITKALSTAIMSIPIVGWVAAAVSALIVMYQTWDEFRALVDGVFNVFKSMLPILKKIGEMAMNIGNPAAFAKAAAGAWSEFQKLDLGAAYKEGYDKSMAESAARRAAETDPFEGLGTATDNQTTTNNPDIQQGLDTVTDGGKSVRNVTVSIENLVKELKVQAATVREGAEDIRRIVLEELVRAVNGAEEAIATR